MNSSLPKTLLILVDALLLLAVLCVAPLAWVLRDGLLGASQTAGFPAVGKAFMTFYAGPVILLLAAVRLLLGSFIRNKQPDKQERGATSRLAAVIILFSALTLLLVGFLMN